MSWGYVAVGVGTAVAGYLGSEAQKEGIESAEEQQAAAAAVAAEREARIYGGTEEFRALSREALPFIREDVLAAEPGTSPLYQRALTGGIEDIQTQLAGYGLADSSVAGKAIGEFTGELSARDTADIRSKRLALASGGTTGIPETLSAASLTAGPSSNLSNLAVRGGEVRGGLYGDLANTALATYGAYKQGQGYQGQQDLYADQLYASQGGYGPYRP